MRLEDVTAEIRPRSDWEAVDLGFALVRRDFWRCLVVWWLAILLPLAACGWFLRDAPVWLLFFVWWWKPAGSRMVLFELSRRLFGEKPSWKSVFREIPRAWFRRFFYRFIWARFSPWLPVMLAIEDLEGLRGKAYRQRAQQLGRRGDGGAVGLYFMAELLGTWLALILLVMAVMLLPDGQDEPLKIAWETWDQSQPFAVPALIAWPVVVCGLLGMSLADVFLMGGGFGIYVNNRTWLEGWDVELAFKRLGARLGKLAAVLVIVLSVFCGPELRADPAKPQTDTELITRIKKDKVFEVHSETHKVPKFKPSSGKPNLSWLENLFKHIGELRKILGIAAVSALVLLLAWLIWKYRHLFVAKKSGDSGLELVTPTAKVVMGMKVTADSLPKDIPAAVWALWQQGKRQEALGLLYRGTISKMIDSSHVDIQESDTEGDCLKRVEAVGSMAFPDYFRGLTAIWINLAYAGKEPPEVEVRTLCEGWPFPERRRA